MTEKIKKSVVALFVLMMLAGTVSVATGIIFSEIGAEEEVVKWLMVGGLSLLTPGLILTAYTYRKQSRNSAISWRY